MVSTPLTNGCLNRCEYELQNPFAQEADGEGARAPRRDRINDRKLPDWVPSALIANSEFF
jgi:hypothetical protein